MYHFQAIIFSVLLSWSMLVGSAIPTFGGHSQIGTLIPGLSSLQAKEFRTLRPVRRHLNVLTTDSHVGNLSLTSSPGDQIPLFYVYHNRLWRYINDTTIYAVNVINGTGLTPDIGHAPLQLRVDEHPGGIDTGTWKWKGTKLVYHVGALNNSGIYYDCTKLPGGGQGLLTYLKDVHIPQGCTMLTLHGYEHDVR